MNIEALLIASGQNIKRLVAARERGPRKQAAALRLPDPVSRCRARVSGRSSLTGAKEYFNRLWCLAHEVAPRYAILPIPNCT